LTTRHKPLEAFRWIGAKIALIDRDHAEHRQCPRLLAARRRDP
jgi:hypothetical protein